MGYTGVRKAAVFLIAVNVIIFMAEMGNASYIDNRFAMYAPAVKQGQWYRIITSCFLHAGFMHIACNMYSLWNLSRIAERYVNAWQFLLVYFAAGICGNLLTYAWNIGTGNCPMSLGASGAIFGIMGLLIALSVTHRANLNAGYLITDALAMLAPGFLRSGISNTAHIGGLAGGFFCGLIVTMTIGF